MARPSSATSRALLPDEVAKPQITDGNNERDRGHYRPSWGEISERHRVAGALRDPESYDIGAGPHGGEFAAEDGAQDQGPPQHTVAGVPGDGFDELSDDRRHRGGIGHVVHKPAEEEGHAEDQHRRHPFVAAGR